MTVVTTNLRDETMNLSEKDVQFASKRSIDRNGRVFYWYGNVYRAIPPAMSRAYSDLLRHNKFSKLIECGLIETERAPIELNGYGLVLKHRKIPFTTYATEWCGPMLKDAALLTLDLNLALLEMGFELQDAHPWNILFEGCNPRFIDFGSIVSRRSADSWHASSEFIGMFYNPLLLMSAGCADEARTLLVHPRRRVGKRIGGSEVALTLLKKLKFKDLFRSLTSNRSAPSFGIKETILLLKERVSSLAMPFEKTAWSDYCVEEVDIAQRDSWIVKRKSVHEVIARCKPLTLLDVGANTGWFSKLAALHGSSVVATDVDETCISRLYLNPEARSRGILPLKMDTRKPPESYGIELRCAAATERLKCEMVLSLAIIHHLVFKQKVRFDSFVKSISTLTKKWLLVEFIPREDKYVSKWYNESFAWYTEENFVAELRKHFRSIEKLPSNPEPRSLFLCER